jgi:DNA-directed RNA polymerase specialized sigma24 family protein
MAVQYIKKEDLRREVVECLTCNKVSSKLCDMFYRIAKEYVSSYNANMEDKEDMVQRAVLYCVKYFRNIDIEQDVFAYVTQICKNAFYQEYNIGNGHKKFITRMINRANTQFDRKYKNK